MFPVFTSRALALTLSFLYAAVLVYSQPDLCLEDDLLVSLQANREAAEQFCRADLQVPDIYNTYLATTLRRSVFNPPAKKFLLAWKGVEKSPELRRLL